MSIFLAKIKKNILLTPNVSCLLIEPQWPGSDLPKLLVTQEIRSGHTQWTRFHFEVSQLHAQSYAGQYYSKVICDYHVDLLSHLHVMMQKQMQALLD